MFIILNLFYCTLFKRNFFDNLRFVELMVDRGMSWEMVIIRVDNFKGKYDGFYVFKRDMYGKKMYFLVI